MDQQISIRLTQRTENGNLAVERTLEFDTTLKSEPRISVVNVVANNKEAIAAAYPAPQSTTGERWVKVMSDGTKLPGSNTAIDHVAVIDTQTGLMWATESLGDPTDADDGISQQECVKRCESLRLLGHDDWTLPTRAQLAALVDDTRHEPAIDTNLFPRVKPRWHWTSTPAAWSSASAWHVDFSGGYVGGSRRGNDGFALAVRRVGQ